MCFLVHILFQGKLLCKVCSIKSWTCISHVEDSDKCQRCTTPHSFDNIEHYFYECLRLRPFWDHFNHRFSGMYDSRINLHCLDIIFGNPNKNDDDIFHVLNFCILFAKTYTWFTESRPRHCISVNFISIET